VNASVEGKKYAPVMFRVTRERVEAFRRLFDGFDRIPPTFLTAAEFSVLPQILGDPELDLDFRRVVHASQEYEYRRPLRVDEDLTVAARIASIRQKGGNGFVTIETTVLDADGSIAAIARSTMIERRAPEP
jgi:acyl-CoA thioesterase FadM